jgi:hypothetical protein
MNFNQLPNFIIIGAAKSGTTTLFDAVGQNPNVFAAGKKEIKYFSRDERYELGVDWYQDTFFKNAEKYPVRMEASPAYLTWSEKTAPRIKVVYQERPIKFAAIFRDPVKRAYSHYWMRVRMKHETLSFSEAIYAEESRLKENWEMLSTKGDGLYGYFRAGCYATKLKPFLELFPRENFYFLLLEDIQNDFNKNIRSLFSFLEIEDTHQISAIESNEAAVPRNKNVHKLYRNLKNSKVQIIFKFLVPKKTRKSFRNKFIYKPTRYPPMDEDIKQYLYSRYLNEVKQFEQIIKRDLSHWYSG